MSNVLHQEACAQHEQHGDRHPHAEGHCEMRVKVPFNSREVYLHKGEFTVPVIKRAAGIPLTDDLEQLVGSKIVPLPEDGKVHISGCEIFLYHPKDGGSS
jgi:hypothetical protein